MYAVATFTEKKLCLFLDSVFGPVTHVTVCDIFEAVVDQSE